MDVNKILTGIDTVIDGLEVIKSGLSVAGENTTKQTGDSTPKSAKKADTKKADTEAVESSEYATMKYNDLKKLAVERGLKKPNVGKAELIAFLSGTPLEEDDDVEDVEAEAPESVSADEEDEVDEVEDLTEKVTELLKDVETEEIADFLTENGISAKGKRPSLIAKIVNAIDEGELSLDDLVVEEDDDEADEPEEAPAPKKADKKADKKPVKKKAEPEPEDDEESDEEESDEDADFGYEWDKKKKRYVDDEEEDELLAEVTEARMDALRAYADAVDEALTDKKKKKKLKAELDEFFDDDLADEDLAGSAITKFLLMTDDDGETHEASDPYSINDIPVCCGQALKQTKDGYVCEICGEEYEDDDE